jgi:hypothetical protein
LPISIQSSIIPKIKPSSSCEIGVNLRVPYEFVLVYPIKLKFLLDLKPNRHLRVRIGVNLRVPYEFVLVYSIKIQLSIRPKTKPSSSYEN